MCQIIGRFRVLEFLIGLFFIMSGLSKGFRILESLECRREFLEHLCSVCQENESDDEPYGTKYQAVYTDVDKHNDETQCSCKRSYQILDNILETGSFFSLYPEQRNHSDIYQNEGYECTNIEK